MALPQIQAALAACDRRDAALALQTLHVTHAANAPLLVGKDGSNVLQKCVSYLKRMIAPQSRETSKSEEGSVFKMLLSRAYATKAKADAQKASAPKP